MPKKIARNPGLRRDTSLLFTGFIVLLLIEYGGLSQVLPFLQTMRFATLLSYSLFIAILVQIGISDLLQWRQTKLLLAFLAFTVLSVIWAVVQWYAVESIRPLVDYTVLFLLTAILVNRQSRVDALSWLFLAVTAWLVLRNFDKLTSSERIGAFEAPYFMGDGNDLAWGLVVMLPFILNLVIGKRSMPTRLLGLAGSGLSLFGVIGTGSRGATLGLGIALLYYWFVMSRRKLLGAAALAVLVVGVIAFAPPQYLMRMQSIAEFGQDNSAQGRLQVWRASVQMAIDRPLGSGAGNFSSAYGRYYIPSESESRLTWASRRWLGAHSIYFKVLGEYGLLGLLLLLAIIRQNLKDNLAARRALEKKQGHAAFNLTWPALLSMAVVGYAACGVFLGGVNYPHLFVLSALVVSIQRSLATPDDVAVGVLTASPRQVPGKGPRSA